MERAGEKNIYHCPTCQGYVVTVCVDDGVTPSMLGCRVKGDRDEPGNDCKGMMTSLFYPPEPWPEVDENGVTVPTEPTFEWYAASKRELRKFKREDPGMYEHCCKGGLLLRKRA